MKNTKAILSRRVAKFWHSNLVRSIMLLTSGIAGAQAINVVFAPLVTRIYGPEAIGILGMFMALVTVILPFGTLTYSQAIILQKEDNAAIGMVHLSIMLSITITTILAALMALGNAWVTKALGSEYISSFMLLIPLAVLFNSWLLIIQQFLIREQEFGIITRAFIAHSVFANIAKCVVGWITPTVVVLIIFSTFSQLIHTTLILLGTRRRTNLLKTKIATSRHISLRELAHRHRDFPLYRAPQNFINAASQSAPFFVLTSLFGLKAAGFYAIANLTMALPSTIAGKAVSDAFYSKISKENLNSKDLYLLILKSTKVLFALGLVPFALVIVFGPVLFGVIFGSEWTTAGEYARFLAVFFLLNFANKAAVAAVPGLKLNRELLIYEIASTALRLLAIMAGFECFKTDVVTLACYCLVGAVAYIGLIFRILVVAKKGLNDETSKPFSL